MSVTTWNPADTTGADVTLSNSNLTASTNTGASQGARSINGQTTGKWYAEFSSMFFYAVGNPGAVGIADSSYGLSAGPGVDNCHSAWLQIGKTLYCGNSTKASAGIINDLTGANVCGLALDVDGLLVWFTTDGIHWNNGGTADPATGTGGIPLTGSSNMGPAIYLAGWLRWGYSGAPYDTATLNGGSSTFTFTKPTGFDPWDGVVLPPAGTPPAFATIVG
jgi:hypothetical protein